MLVEYSKVGKIALLTLNRPEVHNSIDPEMYKELSDVLQDFKNDDSLWAGIITGAGTRAFSVGADIKKALPVIKDGSKPWPPTIMRGLELWKPLVAAVNGMALGGGMEVCLACDIRIAADNANFGLPEVTLGLIPAWGGTQRLPRVIPWALAAEMMFTGRLISAQEAYRIGLVNKVVPQAELLAASIQMAELLCKPGPLAIRAAKQAMLEGTGMSLVEGLNLERDLTAYITQTEDFTEGTKAFLEKRKPDFKGK